MRVVIQDGSLRPDGSVALDADDPAFTRGVAVFETLRTHGRTARHLPLHLDRLASSAAALDIPVPSHALLSREISAAAGRIAGEAVVRVTLTGGGRRIVQARPLPAPPTSVRVATERVPAHPWLSGRVKHTSRAASVAAVRAAGTDEVFWVDGEGMLLEGTWSNIFGVVDGTLRTPPDDGRILPGITRHMLIRAAGRVGLSVRTDPLPARSDFAELYLCSSLKLLCPVVELDGEAAAGAGPIGDHLRSTLVTLYAEDPGHT